MNNYFDNIYVNGKTSILYTNETQIINKVKLIMNNYRENMNEKEFLKKSIELFHLLIYFDIKKEIYNNAQIIPHEPGDFIIKTQKEIILYELVTVFGDIEAKQMTEKIKKVFKFNSYGEAEIPMYPIMDVQKNKKQFKRLLKEKQSKPYFKENKAVLLVVTSEHNRGGTVPWYQTIKLKDSVNKFISMTQANIQVLNYFSSGKDNNPQVSDLLKEIISYERLFDNN